MQITVYSTTHCGSCHGVMRWLEANGHTYKSKIVDQDDLAMEEFMNTNEGMIGTPLTIITNGDRVTKVSGFDQPKLRAALE